LTRQLARPIALHDAGRRDLTRATGQSWYRLRNVASDRTEIYLFNDIGRYGIDSQQFIDELCGLTAKAIDVRLNSHGGEVYDGIAIYNSLLSHPAHVTIHVDGIAASIASVIMQAGDVVKVARNARVMIHDASMRVDGNPAQMRHVADLLDMVSDDIAGVYAERSRSESATWRELMRAETWFSAQEAVDIGLADQVTERARDTAASGDADHPVPPAAHLGAGRGEARVPATAAPPPSVQPVAAQLDPWATLVAGLLKPEEASK
jgi:ATP-dependent protease ClpP protease subunit